MLGLSLGFSLQTFEGNVVGVIIIKVTGCILTLTDGLPSGLSLGTLIRIWEGILLGIEEEGNLGTPLSCRVGTDLVLHLDSSFATQWELY